jgi:hypothetical protein
MREGRERSTPWPPMASRRRLTPSRGSDAEPVLMARVRQLFQGAGFTTAVASEQASDDHSDFVSMKIASPSLDPGCPAVACDYLKPSRRASADRPPVRERLEEHRTLLGLARLTPRRGTVPQGHYGLQMACTSTL